MQILLVQILNGIQLSMLVFLLAVGLTLIFGLMDTLNLAHGAFFTIGAYFGLVVANATNSFWLALLIGPLLPFMLGFILQYFVLQPLAQRGRSTHLDLALLTFGLLFATAGAVEYIYGSAFYSIALPDVLKSRVALFAMEYPVYRLFIIGVGVAVAIALVLLIDRTLIGAILRAGVDRHQHQCCLRSCLRSWFGACGPCWHRGCAGHEYLFQHGHRHSRYNLCGCGGWWPRELARIVLRRTHCRHDRHFRAGISA